MLASNAYILSQMVYFLIAQFDESFHGTHLCHHHQVKVEHSQHLVGPLCPFLVRPYPPNMMLSPSDNRVLHWASCDWHHRESVGVWGVCFSSYFISQIHLCLCLCHFFIVTFYCTYRNLSLSLPVLTNFTSNGHTRYFLFLLLAFYLKGFTSEHSFILRYIS